MLVLGTEPWRSASGALDGWAILLVHFIQILKPQVLCPQLIV